MAKRASDSLFLSVTEFAKITSTCRLTIYSLLNSGDIPAKRIGRSWRIPRSELLKITNVKGAA